MISLVKPKRPPRILIDKAKTETALLIRMYNSNTSKYIKGVLKIEFKENIYNHKQVKRRLIKIQHGKCCFCEVFISHSPGDVEHFRPKGRYRKDERSGFSYPGYFWLAYDWENLLLCCEICNRSFKKNFFPLHDENKRVHFPNTDCTLEGPLFLNPFVDKPEDLITYIGTEPFPVNNNLRAKKTIKYVGLKNKKRKGLNEDRLTHYNRIKKVYEIYMDLPQGEQKAKAKEILDLASSPSSEYSVMIKAAIKNNFEYI